MNALEIPRGRWVDDALEWLLDKDLPEDDRLPETARNLRDVLTVTQGRRAWILDAGLLEPDVPADLALETLAVEIDDAIAIHESIAREVDHDDDPTVRPVLRALRRIATRLEEVGP